MERDKLPFRLYLHRRTQAKEDITEPTFLTENPSKKSMGSCRRDPWLLSTSTDAGQASNKVLLVLGLREVVHLHARLIALIHVYVQPAGTHFHGSALVVPTTLLKVHACLSESASAEEYMEMFRNGHTGHNLSGAHTIPKWICIRHERSYYGASTNMHRALDQRNYGVVSAFEGSFLLAASGLTCAFHLRLIRGSTQLQQRRNDACPISHLLVADHAFPCTN